MCGQRPANSTEEMNTNWDEGNHQDGALVILIENVGHQAFEIQSPRARVLCALFVGAELPS